MSANDRQVAGNHYKKHGGIQHWDLAASRNYDYFQGQITKYVDRWKDKNGIVDLEKAQHFLEKYIEVEKAKLAANNHVELPELGKNRIDKLPTIDRTGMKHPFGFNKNEES